MTKRVWLAALGGLVLLSGCASVARVSAVVTGGVAGAASGNPAVGFAVSFGRCVQMGGQAASY